MIISKGNINGNQQESQDRRTKARKVQDYVDKLDGYLQKYLWKYVDKLDGKIETISQKVMQNFDKYILGQLPEDFEP